VIRLCPSMRWVVILWRGLGARHSGRSAQDTSRLLSTRIFGIDGKLSRPQFGSRCGAVSPNFGRSVTTNTALAKAKPGDNPLEFYKQHVASGELKEDPRQVAALVQLERVWKDLSERKNNPPPTSSSGIMSWFVSSKPQDEVKGLYLYGGVGCGKTFIMDLFFACVPIEKKRRSHFHSFMLEIHQRLHLIRQSGKGRADVATVAEDVVRESGEVFCFDEFNVTDVSWIRTIHHQVPPRERASERERERRGRGRE
jgi:hypothetical protein